MYMYMSQYVGKSETNNATLLLQIITIPPICIMEYPTQLFTKKTTTDGTIA